MSTKDRTDIAVPLSRYNFGINVVNGALTFAGGRAADLGTVVPLLVLRLVGAEWAVGLAAAVQELGRVGTQLFASRLLDTHERKRPSYILATILRIMALCAATWVLLGGLGRGPWFVLGVLLAALFALMVGNGVAEISWADITARSVPSHRRGTLVTLRRVSGLLISLFAVAPLVNYYLSPRSRYAFPANYGMLFLLNTLLSTGAWTAFFMTREPAPHAARRRLSLAQHLQRGRRLLRRDAAYRGLLRLRFLLGVAGAVPTFFIAFGTLSLGLPDRFAAVFLTIRMLGEMAGSVVVGRVSDRIGNRLVICVSTWVALGTFGAATAAALVGGQPGGPGASATPAVGLLGAAFLGLGLLSACRDMGEFNYMLDIAPAAKRPSYIGFGNAFLLPLSLLPIGVGILAPHTGYLPLFAAAALVSALAIPSAGRLDEPRERLVAEAEAAE